MKKTYLLLLMLSFGFSLNAQIINFPDSAFKTYLLSSSPSANIAYNSSGDSFKIDANSNNEIEVSEAMAVFFLNITGPQIVSVEGINTFKNLRTLNISYVSITSLELHDFVFLSDLFLGHAQVNYTMNLDNLPQLRELNCYVVAESDAKLTSLTMSGLNQLTYLRCYGNALTTLDVSEFSSLAAIDASRNAITNVDISYAPLLYYVDLSKNQISSISLLNSPSLFYLNLSQNQLTSLSLPTPLPAIDEVNVSYNHLTTLAFNDYPVLRTIVADANQLSSIQLSNLPNLYLLGVAGNQLTALDLSTLPYLSAVFCQYNYLSALTLPNNGSGLSYLNCSYNYLTSLTFQPNHIYLGDLICKNNWLTTLDVSDLQFLRTLDCRTNQLNTLYMKNNRVETTIQFLGNPNLGFICADSSQLSQVQQLANSNAIGTVVSSDCSIGLASETFEQSAGLKLYPNPVSEVLQIETPEGTEIAAVTVYNVLAQQVLSVSDKGISSLDVSRLESGSYFMRIETAKGTITKRFVKE